MHVLDQVLPLALLDTVSVSTLAIPVWFLLTPRGLRIANVFGYLLIVVVGYFLLGVLLMSALSALRNPLRSALNSPVGDVAVAVVGAALIVTAIRYGFGRRREQGEGRLTRWREAAVGEAATARGVFSVALIAVALEVATMFPYLAAIDILGRDEHSWTTQVSVLALYCLVMIAPAVLATVVRLISKRAVQAALGRVDRWLKDNAQENTAWLFAIAGFMLLSNSSLFDSGMQYLSDR